jgi:hypothetical protein
MNPAGHAIAVDELKLRDPHHDFVTADWMHMPRAALHAFLRAQVGQLIFVGTI